MTWRLATILGLVACLSMAGCLSTPPAGPGAEVRVATAMADFEAAIAPGSGDRVRAVVGLIEVRTPDAPPQHVGDLEIGYHLDEASFVRISFGPMLGSFSMSVWCTPGHIVVETGAGVFLTRPMSDGTTEVSCVDGVTDGFGSVPAFLDNEMLDGLGVAEVTENDDGTVTAAFPTADGLTLVVEVDGADRVSAFEIRVGDVRLVMDVVYGPRNHLVVPETVARLGPVLRTSTRGGAGDGTEIVTVYESLFRAPLNELEAHWLAREQDGGEPIPRATFALDGHEHAHDGLTFRYEDADGDRNLTVGDRWHVTWDRTAAGAGDDWSAWTVPELHLFDLWADRYALSEMPIS